ncbi:CvfB family protein [Nafulsella turpanensis]|uniref:CvfB family protein n=1 Tax=Nafulsella turpanensis TaxID=1265690 RepID=UPI00034CC22B|nr:S1-like domain-containing RNA-binding protein [Nafulsella turpanensis]
MINIGEYNTLKVNREVDFGVYLGDGEEELLLPGKWKPAGTEVGQELRVFVYTDSEDRPIATTMKPAATVGEFAILEVKAVAPFGAFLDWGLEKDLLLPKAEQIQKPAVGDKVVVRICLDYKTNRVIAVSKIGSFLKEKEHTLQPGEEVEAWVYHTTPLGFQVLVNQQYNGLIYRNEVFGPLQTGDRKTAYVSKLREDGKLDLSLKPFGKEGMKGDREKVLEKLEQQGGSLPLGDKSQPEEISHLLNMSKKSFKRAIGMLYKEQKISLSDHEIKLK